MGAIAEIDAASMDTVALLAEEAANGYRPLRVGCDPGEVCEESWRYEWRDGYYGQSSVIVRGHRVDFETSVHGLHALTGDGAVLAEPAAGAIELRSYPAGTEVAIIGTAEDAPYYYVSPCNACESGFVPIDALALGPAG